jgi:hypothetical protein
VIFFSRRTSTLRCSSLVDAAVAALALGAMTALLALVAGPASASVGHPYVSQLTQANSTNFSNPWGLATDSADNLWVFDQGSSLLSEFDSSGAYQAHNDGTGAWSGSPYVHGLTYGKTADQLYVPDANLDDIWGVKAADATNSGTDLFGGAWDSGPHNGCCFLAGAVDNSATATDGDLYVANGTRVTRVKANGAADDFTASGSPSYISANQLTGTSAHSFATADAVATDSTGNVYVADNGNHEVDQFDSTGAFLRSIANGFGTISALAVDPVTGNLFVLDASHNAVDELSPTGTSLGQLSGAATPAGSFSDPQGLAIDSAGNLYVADSGHAVIDRFGPDAVLPEALDGQASALTRSGATLGGTVNPAGAPLTDCHFEYGTDTSYGHTVPCAQSPASIGSGTDPVPVSADISGLQPDVLHHFRLDASNAVGQVRGPDRRFILQSAPDSSGPPRPFWTLDDFATATNFFTDNSICQNGANQGDHNNPLKEFPDCDAYRITATNVGSQVTDGSPVTITADLPAGFTVVRIVLSWEGPGATANGAFGSLNGQGWATCTSTATPIPSTTPLSCEFSTAAAGFTPIQPDDLLKMSVFMTADDPGASGPLTSTATVSGGGAPGASAETHNTVGLADPAFGPTAFTNYIAAPAGSPSTQAGAHPYELTTNINLANNYRQTPNGYLTLTSIHDVKDAVVDLPLGFLGSALATPTCTLAQLSTGLSGNSGGQGCPKAAIVGRLTTKPDSLTSVDSAIWNIAPEHGVAAEFGYVDAANGSHVLYSRVVPGPNGYILQVTSPDIPAVTLYHISTTFFGDPATRNGSGNLPVAMFTNPSQCDGRPLVTAIHLDSWQHPGATNPDGTPDLSDPNWVTTTATSPPVTGCNKLHFEPSVTVKPDSTSADSPAGLDVEIKVPQSEDPGTLATPPLKKGVVVLPAGVSVNPSAADGLGACSPAQIDLDSVSAPRCPDSSKVGTVELQSPLVPGTLKGSIFLATQNDNPFHSLLAGYIVVDDPTTGIVIKLPGKLTPDPETGQITGVFDNNPQFPFSDLKLHFFGGDRGELALPKACGTYTTTTELTPWSAPDSGPPATPSDSFQITSGPGGGPCPDLTDPGRFTPGFSAGTINPQAGAFSPFVLKVSRPDGQQDLKKIDVTLPLGLTAKLAGIPRCAQSAIVPGVGGSTSCPAGSQVGTVTVSAGVGSSPFFLADQPVYLTDGYDGAPFGLAIDTHAVAGPFDLGHVVVRTKLSIDPITTQVSGQSEPLPSILQGIPLHVRSVTLKMDRSTFVLNPTSCDRQTVDGQITGGGANFADPGDDTVKSVSSAFQVGGCASLDLKPKLAITLTGKGQTTDDKHPGVHATVSQTAGQTNLKKVVVSLPLSLALDPDNANGLCEFTDGSKIDPTCPKASIVGKATAHTPILDQALTGPVYFVKNIRKDPKSGREIRTLPKLVIPLTGENGLRLNLVGTSNVVKNRLVTTFDNIPDAPVSDFTLDIAGGKGGILVVSGTDICKASQIAEQQIDGQNGKQLDSNVYLQTSACPLKIISKKIGKTSVAVKVGGLGAGKVTVTGKGIKKTTKTIASSTVATITARRTKGKPGKVTVSFDPTGPAKARKTSK